MEIQEGKPQGVFGSLSNRAPVCGCAAPPCTMLTIAPAARAMAVCRCHARGDGMVALVLATASLAFGQTPPRRTCLPVSERAGREVGVLDPCERTAGTATPTGGVLASGHLSHPCRRGGGKGARHRGGGPGARGGHHRRGRVAAAGWCRRGGSRPPFR